MPNVPLVLGEAVMILGADRRALSAAFLAARLEGESTFSRIAAAGSVALLGMGVAAATGVGAAVKAAAGLEFAISGAGAVAYATTAQLAAMTKQSLELSQASTFSAAEIAASMEVIIKAGLSVEDTLNGAAQATVTLAQAGGVSLARAGDIVATSMQVWDLKTSDLTSTINEIAAAANVSRFDVEDLQRAVASGGTAARLAKIPFDDFMTTIAATAKSFNTGADAGVAFKTFVNRLLPTTKAAREEMQKLGIITKEGLNRFADAEGNIRPMVDIVNVLHESFGKLSTAQQIMSAKIIFGERAGRLAPTLARMTAEEFQQLDKYMKSLDANEIAAMRLDNAQGAAQRLLRTVQALGIEFGMGFLERIKRGAIVAQQELPKIVDALREGLTGKMAPARITVPSIEVLRSTTNQGEEGAARGMVGAGPSNMELLAKRAGEAFRTNVLPRLKEFVDYINSQVLPTLTRFAQHDVWPKLSTFGQVVGTILVGAFRALTAVLVPVVDWLSRHKEVLGSLIAGYITYITVSRTATLVTTAYTRALVAYQTVAKSILAIQAAFTAGQAAASVKQITAIHAVEAAEIAASAARATTAKNTAATAQATANALSLHASAIKSSTKSTVTEIVTSQTAASRAIANASKASTAASAADAAHIALTSSARGKAVTAWTAANDALLVAEKRLSAATVAETAALAWKDRTTLGSAAQQALAQRNVAAATSGVVVATNQLAAAQVAALASSTSLTSKAGGLMGVIRLVTSNIGLMVFGVAALVTVGVALYKNWDQVEKVFGNFAPVLAVILGGVYALVVAWTGYTIVSKAATIAQAELNLAMLANPAFLLVAGITAVIASMVLLAWNLDTVKGKYNELTTAVDKAFGTESSKKASSWFDAIVKGIIISLPPLLGFVNAVKGLADLFDKLKGKGPTTDVTGGRAAGEIGGRTQGDEVPRDENGRPLSLAEQNQTLLRTSGNEGADWRTAPPSNPNYMAKKGPPNIIPPGMKYDPELDSLIPDPDFSLGDYTAPPGGWEMPAVDEKAKKKKDEEDRMKNAIDALNTRFFNDLSDELFKNPNASLGPLITKQGAIRAEIARTTQMLIDTLGVDVPTAFEKASELVLKRIDDMEKELEKGPKLSGFLGFLAAAFEENMAKFQVGIGSATAKAAGGDSYTVNGGINITPDPDVPGGIDMRKVDTTWKQAKLVKAYE